MDIGYMEFFEDIEAGSQCVFSVQDSPACPIWYPSWGNMNFSRIGAGVTKWFCVTIEGYLS